MSLSLRGVLVFLILDFCLLTWLLVMSSLLTMRSSSEQSGMKCSESATVPTGPSSR